MLFEATTVSYFSFVDISTDVLDAVTCEVAQGSSMLVL